ncbi:MAG: branched-chain amino acid ABC transporter ATP-binding protein/permease [Nocardioidaceae bacterium]
MTRPQRQARFERKHALALVVTLLALGAAPFLLSVYALGLLTLGLSYGLFAFGLDLTWGRAGVVSIGHAAFFGLGAYGVAIAENRQEPVLVGALLAVIAAGLVAYLVGRTGLSGRAVVSTMAIATLALTLLAEQAARTFRSVTNGGDGLFVPPPGVVENYLRTAGLVLVVVVTVWLTVLRGSLGRRFLAVRVNEERAAHLGIDPGATKTMAFVLGAAVSAAAGAIAAPAIGLVSPSVAGVIMSTQVLVWLAVGGRGTILGAFLGAILVTVGQQYLGDAMGSWYLLALGVIFLLVVRFLPAGLVGAAVARLRSVNDAALQGARLALPSDERGYGTAALTPGSLLLQNLSKRFDAAVVVDGVELVVPDGQVVCLIGPNGAGKTTLLNVVAGDLPASAGEVILGDANITSWSTFKRARHGLGRVFQIPNVFVELTPRQNLLLARIEGAQHAKGRPIALPPELARFEELDDMLARDLPLADRRALELAMALAWGPSVLLLDEPAAGLSHEDSIRLARTLREVNARSGCTLVTVEHDMEIVRELADRVVVLANGRLLVDGSMDEVVSHSEVRSAYLGAV